MKVLGWALLLVVIYFVYLFVRAFVDAAPAVVPQPSVQVDVAAVNARAPYVVAPGVTATGARVLDAASIELDYKLDNAVPTPLAADLAAVKTSLARTVCSMSPDRRLGGVSSNFVYYQPDGSVAYSIWITPQDCQ